MCQHVIVPEGVLTEVGVGYAPHETGRNPKLRFGVHIQTFWVLGSDAGAREVHECLRSLLDGCAVWDGNDCC